MFCCWCSLVLKAVSPSWSILFSNLVFTSNSFLFPLFLTFLSLFSGISNSTLLWNRLLSHFIIAFWSYIHTTQRLRFVSDKNDTSYSFKIPLKGCGTSKVNIDIEAESIDIKGFENIIVIQNNPHYQAINDSVRMIVCRYTETPMSDFRLEKEDKRILFKPFTVDMLDVITVPMSGLRDNHQVSCWMDITRGIFPHSKPIDGPVKVGENLTMAIYIKDRRETTDLRVKDCYAYDSREDAVRGGKPIIMLTSDQGCPLNHKLIDFWKTTTSTGSSGASVVAYTTISAFKFPEKENVFLSCNVELCTNGCLTFCNDDPNSQPHTLSPAFNAGGLDSVANHNSPVHRHLTNVSFVTTVSTSTPATDGREREFDFLNHKLPQTSRIHRISTGSGPSNFATSSHETEELDDVDVILNGDVNPKADFARLVFQGTDAPVTTESAESRVGDNQESTTTTPRETETTTVEEGMTTAAATSFPLDPSSPTTLPTTQSPESIDTVTPTTVSSSSATDVTTLPSETRATESPETTTTGRGGDLQQENAKEEDAQKEKRREGKAKSQEVEDKEDEDISVIKPMLNAGVKGGSFGTKGGSGSSSRGVSAKAVRKLPAFVPRSPSAAARRRAKKEDRIGSSASSTSQSSTARRRNRSRKRDANRRSRTNNRRRKLVSQASTRETTSSERGWRMEPLPSHLDTGFSDIPFRATRQSRRYLRPPPHQSFSSPPVSSYQRRA